MGRKVTLVNTSGTSRGRVKGMQYSYAKPSNMKAYPRRSPELRAAIAMRNILIYCEISHTYDKTDKEIKADISKRFAMPVATINSIYYKTSERLRTWRQQRD